MIVESVMKKELVTLVKSDTISQAIKLMNVNKIRHLPVVNDNYEVIGLVTDRDIRTAKPDIFQLKNLKEDLEVPVEEIMNKNVITGHPLDFVSETAGIFYEYDIGCLPIVENDVLVGIITETDLLHTLVQLTGTHQPGSQIEIRVTNKAKTLCTVATIVAKHSTNILSILFYPDEELQSQILVVRIPTLNPTAVVRDLIDSGFEVLWPQMPGIMS